MENNRLQELIKSFLPEAEVTEDKQFLTITIDKSLLHQLAEKLKDSVETRFDYLFCESAVDYNDHLMMVYHLDSTTHRHQLVLKSKITDRENPEIDSVCDLWETANYHEREIFDLFGIRFIGHTDMRKIFLDNDWVGFPMRKDYVDTINVVER